MHGTCIICNASPIEVFPHLIHNTPDALYICEKCMLKIQLKYIIITGWTFNSNGRVLQFKEYNKQITAAKTYRNILYVKYNQIKKWMESIWKTKIF